MRIEKLSVHTAALFAILSHFPLALSLQSRLEYFQVAAALIAAVSLMMSDSLLVPLHLFHVMLTKHLKGYLSARV